MNNSSAINSSINNTSLNLSFLTPETYNPATDTIQQINGRTVIVHHLTPEELQPYVMAFSIVLFALFFLGGLWLGKSKRGQNLKAKIQDWRHRNA
jgi:hypothetical protein